MMNSMVGCKCAVVAAQAGHSSGTCKTAATQALAIRDSAYVCSVREGCDVSVAFIARVEGGVVTSLLWPRSDARTRAICNLFGGCVRCAVHVRGWQPGRTYPWKQWSRPALCASVLGAQWAEDLVCVSCGCESGSATKFPTRLFVG
jgi:hypothetical protein